MVRRNHLRFLQHNLTSYPAFEVMLEREGKKSVFVNCLMRNPDANNELPEDQEVNDSFAIMSMTVSFSSTNLSNLLFRWQTKTIPIPIF